MTRLVPLTKGQFALVDDEEHERLSQYRWWFNSKGYAVRSYTVNGKQIVLCMHRIILNAQRGQYVDHIDDNRLNNVRSNLRLCTQQQNLRRRCLFKNSSTHLKGVTRFRGQWHARIGLDGGIVHLGFYHDPETAALVYDAAARCLFGEYTNLNFPDRPTSAEIEALAARALAKRK
jgi:HNH endonuclease